MNPLLRYSALLLSMMIAAQRCLAAELERTHQITIDDYFTQGFVTECVISPAGDRVAYVERRFQQPDEPTNTDIWLVDATTRQIQRLTFDLANDRQPRWSPDGKTIYFLSNQKREAEKSPPYNGTVQVWSLEIATGRMVPLTRVADGVDNYQVSTDGKTLYYTTSRKHLQDEWKNLKKDFADLTYGDGVHQVSALWKIDLASFRATVVSDQNRYIHSFEVSPDEEHVALITTEDNRAMTSEGGSRVDILESKSAMYSVLPDDLWRKQAPSPYGWLEHLRWSSDSMHLAFIVDYDGYPAELLVASWNRQPVSLRKMPCPEDVSVADGLAWRGKEPELCYLGDYHATKRVYGINGISSDQPTTRALTQPDVVIDAFSVSEAGDKLGLLQTALTYSRDVFLGQATGGSTRLTNVNPQIDTWKLPSLSRVTWKGAHGDDVEGILELPPDYKTGTRLPMIVSIHGGPTACDYLGLQYSIYGRTQFSTQGYAVFCPNYRGSTGYGDKFLTDLIGHENDVEVEDILKGVDALIERGIADPERLGVMGWSNGGYLTNCLITRTNRFKAASSGAGVFDMTLQWGTQDTPGHVVNFTRGLPWKQPAEYQRASPLYQLNDTFCTPTLIHVGEKDERVPAAHSIALHRALHDYLKVPTELVIYPGAPHSIGSYKQRLAKLKWDQVWFDKYLGKPAK